MAVIQVNTRYSENSLFDYSTKLERISLDQARRHDILNGDGFIVTSRKNIKEDVKDPNGIFSRITGCKCIW